MPTNSNITGFTPEKENYIALPTAVSVYDFSTPPGEGLGAPISCEEPQAPLVGKKMKFHTINPGAKQREVQEIGG